MINNIKLSHAGYNISKRFIARRNNTKLSKYQRYDDFSISNLFMDMGYFLGHTQSGINPTNGYNRLSARHKSITSLSKNIYINRKWR